MGVWGGKFWLHKPFLQNNSQKLPSPKGQRGTDTKGRPRGPLRESFLYDLWDVVGIRFSPPSEPKAGAAHWGTWEGGNEKKKEKV